MRSWPHVGQTTALGGGGVGLIGVCGMKTGVNVGGWTKMRVSVGLGIDVAVATNGVLVVVASGRAVMMVNGVLVIVGTAV